MRLMKLLMTCGILGCMLTATTFAQSFTRISYNDSYAYFAPSDKGPSAPDAAAEKDKKTEAAPEEEKKEEEAAPEEEKAPEPKRLIGQVGCTKLNITGWLDAGGTINPDYPPSHYNGTLAPNDRNEFQFNQLYMVMERPLKIDECHPWDIGARVDLLYGTDYIFCESLGFETNPDGSPKWNSGIDYGLAMPQAYLDIGYDKYDLKIGRFYTILGYESMMAISNFFYSMNYTLRYAEPTTHTGGLLTYKKSDEISYYIGGVNGQDQTDGVVDSFGAVTGFAWTPKDKKYALNFGIMTGCLDPTLNPTVYAPRTEFSTYLTYNFNKKWQSVSQWDAGWQQDYDLQGHQADYFSFTQYLFYTINDCWKAGLRYDLFNDGEGTKLGGLRFGGLPGGNPLPLPSDNAGIVQAITAGLNWTPNPNFRLRPELRWDWFGGTGPQPLFNGQNRQFTLACDGIIQF